MKEDKKLNMSQQVIEKRNISVLQNIKADSFEEDGIFQFTLNFFFEICCAVLPYILASCRGQKTGKENLKILRPSSKKSALHKDLKDV